MAIVPLPGGDEVPQKKGYYRVGSAGTGFAGGFVFDIRAAVVVSPRLVNRGSTVEPLHWIGSRAAFTRLRLKHGADLGDVRRYPIFHAALTSACFA